VAKTAITVGLLLILIGIVSYVGSGGASVTALIPAFFGVPIFACGLVARNELRRKHAMHGAVVFGLLGFLGSLRFVPQLGQAMSGQAERPLAVYAGTAMCVICLVFVIACVKSFIAARKAA
jgi:uncharacterized membrane protein